MLVDVKKYRAAERAGCPVKPSVPEKQAGLLMKGICHAD